MEPSASPNIILTPDAPLEKLKNKILAAFYQEDMAEVSNLLDQVIEISRTASIGETDEKYLRQILIAIRRFKNQFDEGISLTITEQYRQFQVILRDKARDAEPYYLDYTTWTECLNLNTWQWTQLFTQAITFQMTSGCSNVCRRCNEWALPKVRGHFTFKAVNTFIQNLLDHKNSDLALYGGSDPLDWIDPPHDITHVMARMAGKSEFSLLTKIPKGKGSLAKTLAEESVPMSVSLTNRNRERIKSLEQEMAKPFTKQHATKDLLIPACLDEDFATTKPSITDSYGTEISLDGAFTILPTFTSALHPFGHKKIPIGRNTNFIPLKKLGRPALLVDYFKPLEVVTKNGTMVLPHLLDIQVENILLDNGDYDLTPPGMRSVKEYFEIFDSKARRQRKKMTLSVVRRFKNETGTHTRYHDLPLDEKEALRDKIQTHLDFTREKPVLSARVAAASFFLNAVRSYLEVSPTKAQIIKHLTYDEFKRLKSRAQQLDKVYLKDLFGDPSQDAWMIFRTLALSLVHGESLGSVVNDFLTACQARYDSDRDIFATKPG